MKLKMFVLFFVALPVILLDQVSKRWIAHSLSPVDSLVILENFFHIRHLRNTAGAFGSFSWMSINVFIILTLGAIGVMGFLFYKLKTHQHAPAAGLALIVGGAIGNLIDRIMLGSVIDFIDIHYYAYHWPAFNMADSAITIGTFILAACIALGKW